MRGGWLRAPSIIRAFRNIKRSDFLSEELKGSAELDTALPIGSGQTISQPAVVAFMLELLQARPGDKILDVGSGSGWTSALLAEIVGKKGKVISIERIPELKIFGEKNISKYNFIKKGIVEMFSANGYKGSKKNSPFDKILAGASLGKKVPDVWREQLKIGGKIVTPIRESIWEITKKNEKIFEDKEYPGFLFVPMIES